MPKQSPEELAARRAHGRHVRAGSNIRRERRQQVTRLSPDWIMRHAAKQCGVAVRPDIVGVVHHEKADELLIGPAYHFRDANRREDIGGAYGKAPLNVVRAADGQGWINTYR